MKILHPEYWNEVPSSHPLPVSHWKDEDDKKSLRFHCIKPHYTGLGVVNVPKRNKSLKTGERKRKKKNTLYEYRLYVDTLTPKVESVQTEVSVLSVSRSFGVILNSN